MSETRGKNRWALRFSSGVTFQCPTKSLLVLNPMDFPLHFLNYDFLPKGFWWFPTACGVHWLHLASKHLWCFNILGANNNCALPCTKLDTITLSSRHGSSLPSPTLPCAFLPCAYIMSSAENFLLLTPPLAGIYSSPNVSSSSISNPPPLCAASVTCNSGSVRQNYI